MNPNQPRQPDSASLRWLRGPLAKNYAVTIFAVQGIVLLSIWQMREIDNEGDGV